MKSSPREFRWGSTGSDRRSFLRGLLGGVGIAVPALRVLASSPAASAAETIPKPTNPCAKTYTQYLGHYCTTGVQGSCQAGIENGNCIGEYIIRSVATGEECGSFTDTECTRCCGPLAG